MNLYATPAVATVNNAAFDARDTTIFTSASFY
jgi:hypothetical protein